MNWNCSGPRVGHDVDAIHVTDLVQTKKEKFALCEPAVVASVFADVGRVAPDGSAYVLRKIMGFRAGVVVTFSSADIAPSHRRPAPLY